MIGIYKYTNKINGKIYIGSSNDIQRRKNEHLTKANANDKVYFHQAIRKYGINNFDFEVLETFDIEDRNLMGEREKYWIQYYNSYEEGYNETIGGGISNGRPKLSEKDVIDIRTRYNNRERCMIVFEDYKDRIRRSGFNKIWKGETWKTIMPEVYTEENKNFHKHNTGNFGSYNGRAKLNQDIVNKIRERMKKEKLHDIWEQDFTELFPNYKSFYNSITTKWKS